jgi:hypothetical protein
VRPPAARLTLAVIVGVLLLVGALFAAPDDNISTRATIHINRAFVSPGSELSAVYLATSGGRISVMGDSDNALMAWLVRQDGAQIVVTLVKETK